MPSEFSYFRMPGQNESAEHGDIFVIENVDRSQLGSIDFENTLKNDKDFKVSYMWTYNIREYNPQYKLYTVEGHHTTCTTWNLLEDPIKSTSANRSLGVLFQGRCHTKLSEVNIVP